MNLIKKALPFLLPYIGLAVYTLFFILFVEWIYRGSSLQVYKWIRPEYHEFILVYIFMLAIFLVFHMFKRKIFLSLLILTSVVICLGSVINRVKLTLRGDPLIPADVMLLSEARNMLSFLADFPIWKIALILLGAILSLIIVIYTIYKLPKDKYWTWHRVIMGVGAASLIAYIFYQEVEAPYSDIRAKYGIKVIDYNQKTNYELNGFIMAFMRNIKWLTVDPPANYTKDNVQAISKNYQKGAYPISKDKPHIVMIMSEAFWDPTLIDSVDFNQDPLPNFRMLSKQEDSGSLLVPVFGGSTANTEFEALTGYSMNFLPAGSIPYLFYLKKPVQALPNILKEQGYDTTAIHSYHNWFYQRNLVYKNLGFNRFISVEYIPNPVVDALYYRDKEINDLIIEQIKSAEEPHFIFAVTIQNHGPFRDNLKKPYATIDVAEKDGMEKMTASSKNILEYYSDNIVQVDLELKRLVEEFEKMNEKVILVYFGDHLPLLGNNYQVYREGGYFHDEGTYKEYNKMYTTPLLVWDNYTDTHDNLQITSSFLPAYILKKSGLPGTPLMNMLNTAIKNGSNYMPREDFLKEVQFNPNIYEEYKVLQYDSLFGKQYSERNGLSNNRDFRLGYQDPKINKVETSQTEEKRVIEVTGEYLTKFTKIFLNDEQLETVYQDGVLRATIPGEEANGEVQVKILDSYNRVLSESNVMKLK